MILLDTSILSLAFRRRGSVAPKPEAVGRLEALIADGEILAIPGIVLQELLTGVRTAAERERLQEAVAGYPVLLAERRDHLEAARLATELSRVGVATSTVDCLIAAQAINQEIPLLTVDADFQRIASHSRLALHPVKGRR